MMVTYLYICRLQSTSNHLGGRVASTVAPANSWSKPRRTGLVKKSNGVVCWASNVMAASNNPRRVSSPVRSKVCGRSYV